MLLGMRQGLTGSDPSPVINWDFLQSQSLTSFSRTSNATLFDSTGKLTYAANNTAVNSAVYNTNWTLAGISSITTGVSDPVGGTAASSMVEDGTTGLHRIYSGASSCFTAVAGVSYLVSLDIKPGTRTWTRLFLGGGPINGGLGVYAYFNLSGAGSVGTSTATSPGVVQLANGWYRAYFKVTAGSAGLTALYIEGATADTVNSYAGSNGATALSVYNLVAAAVTHETTPRSQDQVITTANPYYGPRYPYAYNGTTWDAQGLLVEAAGTNLLSYSEQFDNAVWKRDAISPPTGVAQNAVISPDGTQNADLIYPGSSATQAGSLYRATTTGTVVSVYAKAAGFNYLCLWNVAGSTGAAWFNLSNGTLGTVVAGYTATIINAGNGWYRCSLRKDDNTAFVYVQVQAASADNSTTPTASGTNGIYIYGAQFETGDQATSYIPNLATGTTTRNADTSLAFSAISLPTGLSFSRASNAMQYDAAGRLTYAPNNLLTQSNTFSNSDWAWGVTPVIVSTNNTDPLGGSTATRTTIAAAPQYLRHTNVTGLGQGTQVLVTVWVKQAPSSSATSIRLTTNDTLAWNTGFSTKVTLSSSWQQISGVFTVGSSGALRVIVGAFDAGGSEDTSCYGDVLVYGATASLVTYETVARPCDQLITTTSAYYGPRYDYDPLTRLPKGLLIEEGRTNIAGNTDILGIASWTPYGSSRSGTVTGPNGVANSAQTITASAGGTYHQIQSATIGSTTPNANYTLSVYAKAGTTSFACVNLYSTTQNFVSAVFNLNDTTATIASETKLGTTSGTLVSTRQLYIGNGWFRLSVTGSFNRTDITPLLCIANAATGNTFDQYGDPTFSATGNETISLFGAQLEAGSFPTSYIPNPGIASGIRSADVANVTGANFSSYWNATEGTFYFAGASNTDTGSSAWCFSADDGTLTGNSLYAFCNGAPVTYRIYRSSGLEVDINAGNRSQGVKFKVATGYKANDAAASLNGSAAIADTSVTLPTVDRLNIGRSPSGQFYLNGHIAALKYWRARLSNAKLQTETA